MLTLRKTMRYTGNHSIENIRARLGRGEDVVQMRIGGTIYNVIMTSSEATSLERCGIVNVEEEVKPTMNKIVKDIGRGRVPSMLPEKNHRGMRYEVSQIMINMPLKVLSTRIG